MTLRLTVLFVFVLLSGGSKKALYQRNEKLDQKISLYGGDITKLEIDAIVNAGRCVNKWPSVHSWIIILF